MSVNLENDSGDREKKQKGRKKTLSEAPDGKAVAKRRKARRKKRDDRTRRSGGRPIKIMLADTIFVPSKELLPNESENQGKRFLSVTHHLKEGRRIGNPTKSHCRKKRKLPFAQGEKRHERYEK